MSTKLELPPIPLKPGDVLLYSSGGPVGFAIKMKTWSYISHVEVVAYTDSRHYPITVTANVPGVQYYPFAGKNLYAVLRPVQPFDAEAANRWFRDHALGQKYDYLGLIRSFYLRKPGSEKKMWCSEVATGFLRAGGIEPFRPEVSAEQVSPSMFEYTDCFTWEWERKKR